MTDWNDLLKESIGTPEVPGGRGRKKKSGLIEPSSRETVAACKASLAATDKAIANAARVAANLERHTNDKARRHKQVTADTNVKHIQETERRYRRQQAKIKNPNRLDALYFLLAVAFVFGCILIIPILGGVK